MTENKMKIVFAPGCFDNFEGTQEELDEMVKDIQDMFNNHSPEELRAMSTRVEDIEDLPDEFIEQLMIDLDEPKGRKLQ